MKYLACALFLSLFVFSLWGCAAINGEHRGVQDYYTQCEHPEDLSFAERQWCPQLRTGP